MEPKVTQTPVRGKGSSQHLCHTPINLQSKEHRHITIISVGGRLKREGMYVYNIADSFHGTTETNTAF